MVDTVDLILWSHSFSLAADLILHHVSPLFDLFHPTKSQTSFKHATTTIVNQSLHLLLSYMQQNQQQQSKDEVRCDFVVFSRDGEVCVASSRVFVQEGIYDEFEKKLVEKAKTWVIGDPFDPKVQQGPQVDKKQFEKVLSYIEHGKREGATLLTGGKTVGNKGYYIEPTIFSNIKDDMVIAQDEIFGPVMALKKFKTIEEAIKSANNTRYGLAAGIVTKNLDIANTVSRSIRAGTIWINCYFAFGDDIPFGGYKMSGFGRDYGLEALHKYLQVKSVVTPIYNSPWL